MTGERLQQIGIAALVVLLTLAFVVPLCVRAIILSDEGYLLQQALDMLDGRVLYRDMDAFVAPGAWFMLAGVFSVFEPSVLTSRIPVVFAYLALTWVVFRITARVSPGRWAFGALGLLAIACVWAFPVWTFAFYSPFSVLFSLLALERLLAWRESDAARDLVLTGVAIGLSIVFKQNYGAFALVGTVLGFLALRLEDRGATIGAALRDAVAKGAWVAAGVAAIGVPTLVYFALHGAIPDVWQSLVVHPFEFGGRQDIPYLGFSKFWEPGILDYLDRLTYGTYALNHHPAPFPFLPKGMQLVERLHVGLYWIPVAVFGAGFALGLRPLEPGKRFDGPLYCVLALCAMVFLGVFPRADFNHLINVYQVVVVAAVVVAQRAVAHLPTPRPAWATAGFGVVWAVIALYASVSIYWYEAMVRKLDTEMPQRRGGVLVSEPDARMIGGQVTTIVRQTRPGEPVLTLPDLAMLNFLAERPVPSKYYNLYEHHIAHDQGASVAEAAELRGVDLAVTRYENFFSDRVGLLDYAPALTDYLRRSFKTWFVVGNDEYIYFVRRDRPIELPEKVDFLEQCDLEGARPERFVNHHLLFSSLYHYPGTGERTNQAALETRCTLVVPEDGADLVLRVGYRRPGAANATLRAQIRADSAAGSETLLDEHFLVGVKDRWGRPDHALHRFDLSHLAGEEVTLVFRTERRGRVQVHFLDFKGFAMVFEDPRLELRRPPIGDEGA